MRHSTLGSRVEKKRKKDGHNLRIDADGDRVAGLDPQIGNNLFDLHAGVHRGTSLIRNTHFHRITIGP